MDFNEAEEARRRIDTYRVWNGDPDNLEPIAEAVRRVSSAMSANAQIARYHLGDVQSLLEGEDPFEIPEAHMVLADCYRRGHGVEANPSKALHHLQRAVALGSHNARWWYATLLVRPDGLETVLRPDTNQAIEIFRELAWADDPRSEFARRSLVPLLIKGKHAGQLSSRDQELVDQYSGEHGGAAWAHYYDLARFYSDGITSKDYAGPEYRRARELLIRGIDVRDPRVQQQCATLLDQWKVKPLPPAPLSVAEKAVIGVKLSFVVGVLIVWALIGTALLALVSFIGLYIGLPIVVILMVVGFIASLRKG